MTFFFDERNTESVGYTLLDAAEDGLWGSGCGYELQLTDELICLFADHHYNPDDWTPGSYSSRHWWRWEVFRHLEHYLPVPVSRLNPGQLEQLTHWLCHECGECQADDNNPEYAELQNEDHKKAVAEHGEHCCECADWAALRQTLEAMPCQWCKQTDCTCETGTDMCRGYNCRYDCHEPARVVLVEVTGASKAAIVKNLSSQLFGGAE